MENLVKRYAYLLINDDDDLWWRDDQMDAYGVIVMPLSPSYWSHLLYEVRALCHCQMKWYLINVSTNEISFSLYTILSHVLLPKQDKTIQERFLFLLRFKT